MTTTEKARAHRVSRPPASYRRVAKPRLWARELVARPAAYDTLGPVAKKDRSDAGRQARSALIVAAMRRSIVTCGELGKALGIDGVALRNEMRHILGDLSEDGIGREEPSLATLVVDQRTGAPRTGMGGRRRALARGGSGRLSSLELVDDRRHNAATRPDIPESRGIAALKREKPLQLGGPTTVGGRI